MCEMGHVWMHVCPCVPMCVCVCVHMCMGGMAMDPLPPDPYDDHHVPEKRLPPELCQNSGSTLFLWFVVGPGLNPIWARDHILSVECGCVHGCMQVKDQIQLGHRPNHNLI